MSQSAVQYRDVHPFAWAIKEIASVYEEDSFEFITDMYNCRYVKTIFPFYVYYFDYVYNNEYGVGKEDGLVKMPLDYSTYDPLYLQFNANY
jgi:hypothetical protein